MPLTSAGLYVCGTPIGNLEDVTHRLLRVLDEVDLIVAEDTRQTRKLLSRYEIHQRLISYNKDNEASRIDELIHKMLAGTKIALVSDAGMPGISDPGHRLIKECIVRGVAIEIIPGPSAFVAALVLSGLSTDLFTFAGFAPRRKGERTRWISSLSGAPGTLIFYESPHRVMDLLEDLAAVLGDRQAALVRELTKIFEEVRRGSLAELTAGLKERPAKGEIVVLVEGKEISSARDKTDQDSAGLPHDLRLRTARFLLGELMKQGATRREAAKQAGEIFGINSREIYASKETS